MNEARKKWLHAYRFARLEVKREESEKKAAPYTYGVSPGVSALEAKNRWEEKWMEITTLMNAAEAVTDTIDMIKLAEAALGRMAKMVTPPVVMSSGRNKKAADSWMVQFGPSDPPPAPGEIIVKNNQGGYSRVPLPWFKITEV